MFQHRDCPKLDTTNILSEIMDRNHKTSGAAVSRTFYEATLTKTWVLFEKSSTEFRWIYSMFEQVSIHSMVQAMKMEKLSGDFQALCVALEKPSKKAAKDGGCQKGT